MIIEELVAKLGLDLDEAGFEKAAEALEGLKLGLGAVAGIAAAVGGALVAVTKSVAENAVELSKSAQRAGVAVGSYQELAFAAEQSGISNEELQGSLIRLSRTAFEAAHGSHEAAFAFRQLGVGVYDANGKAKPTDQLLEDLADKFASMPDGIRKTALATQAFGRGGAQIIPFLNKGRAGIDELRKAAQDYGIVLDDDVIAAAKRWEEQQKHLFASLKGLRNAIGGEMLKRLGDLTERIAEWIKNNRELITSRLFYWLDNLKQLLIPIAKVIDEIFIKTDAWKYSLIALAAILAVINWPLLLIVGALLAIEDAYKFFEGKPSVLGHIFGDEAQQERIRGFMRDIRDFIKFLFSGEALQAPPWLEKLLGLGDFKTKGVAATPEQVAGAVPVDSLTPAQRGESGAQAFAHWLFGNPDIWKSISVVPAAQPPSIALPSAGGKTVSSNLTVNQTINAAQGMDEKTLANRAAEAAAAVHQKHMREGYAATDQ